MKIVQHGKKRKAISLLHNRRAISPVLATVILIAITLIAAIAVAGFVFGLFGSFTSSATVSAQVTSCISTGTTNQICIVNLTNTGSGNTAVNTGLGGCSINVAGVATAGTPTGTTLVLTAGSGAHAITCTVTGGSQQASGAMATGSFSTSNAATIPFSGTWQ